MKRIVVLLSGNGSNLQAILDASQQGVINGQVVAVYSDNASAYGLFRARSAHIPAYAINRAAFSRRDDFDQQLLTEIAHWQPDLVVLAGFMHILSVSFVDHFHQRLLNIHPSLLPKYPGLHTHRQVLANGDRQHGATVHFVTAELDSGPVILQAKIPVWPDDSEEILRTRVQQQEHQIYPQVISWFLNDRLHMHDDAAWLDGQKLPPQGYTLC